MKKIAAWACLVIYLNAAAQSLLPWVFDGLAHIFLWQDHLEHVHHGQVHSHHVGLEMAAQADNTHDHSPANHASFYSQDVLSAHFVPTSVVWLPLATTSHARLTIWWSFDYQNIFSDIFLPPPDRAV